MVEEFRDNAGNPLRRGFYIDCGNRDLVFVYNSSGEWLHQTPGYPETHIQSDICTARLVPVGKDYVQSEARKLRDKVAFIEARLEGLVAGESNSTSGASQPDQDIPSELNPFTTAVKLAERGII